MSSVNYEFVSPHRTGWRHSTTCDLCGLTVAREGRPPKNENEGGHTTSFPKGAFAGWCSISTRVTGLEDEVDVYLDLCPSCCRVLFDSWVERGLDWTKSTSKTIYLDAAGQPVADEKELAGLPMCVWRAEGKLGIRPCRRYRGHEGECSPLREGVECPLCASYATWSENDTERPPLIYSQRALEHHAVTEHYVTPREDGRWAPDQSSAFARSIGGTFASAYAALEALVR